MSGAELVVASGNGELALSDSSWGDACREIDKLVDAEEIDSLDEIRGAAAAHELFERRRKNQAAEARYARLRLLTEAGIGVLSFTQPTVVKTSERGRFRLLAAAYERGVLLEVASRAKSLSFSAVAEVCLQEGFGHIAAYKVAPSLRGSLTWMEARSIAREHGVSLRGLPCDPRVARREQEKRRQQGLVLKRAYAAQRRRTREANRRDVAREAAEFGAGLDVAYEHLRKTIAAFDASFRRLKEEDRRERRHKVAYDEIFEWLYGAEDRITRLLQMHHVFSSRGDEWGNWR